MWRHPDGAWRSTIDPTRRWYRLVLAAAGSLLCLCACAPQGSSTAAAVCQPASTRTGSIRLTLKVPSPGGVLEQPQYIVLPAPPPQLYGGGLLGRGPFGYAPAQIRAAYDLPALPGSAGELSLLTGPQRALFGAGQTVYLIDAYSMPDIAQDLTYFSQQYGLPVCKTVSIAPTTPLPLAPADLNAGCELSVVYATDFGGMTATAPAYNARWHFEIVLDVEAVHAIAPLARIVLIETPDSMHLNPGVILADTMGPGIVSMSYSTAEFQGEDGSPYWNADDSYVSSTGDGGGPFLPWPAVDPDVLACGATSLMAYNSGGRLESAWSGTGGGISALVREPSYQDAVPGLSSRSTADVSLDGDPATGQYIAYYPVGSNTPQLRLICGTSVSAPEWAGILAIADAERAAMGEGVVGRVQDMLYQTLNDPATYAQVFNDITTGTNGTCGAECTAHVGYDQPTGLGTPNVSSLLAYLTRSAGTTPPRVGAMAVTGVAGEPLSVAVACTAPDKVQWVLGQAPPGMAIDPGTGAVSWAKPTVGSYAVTVTAIDQVTGLSGSATLGVTILPMTSPVLSAATVAAVVGHALSYQVHASSETSDMGQETSTSQGVGGAQGQPPSMGDDTIRYAIRGAPSGMSIGASSGVLSWPSPVAGAYPVTVTATNASTGLSGSAVLTVQVSSVASGPSLTVLPLQGTTGHALSAVLATASDTAATQDQLTIRGAPVGMSFAVRGASVLLTWPTPVCGGYSLSIIATDASGLSVQKQVTITIATS